MPLTVTMAPTETPTQLVPKVAKLRIDRFCLDRHLFADTITDVDGASDVIYNNFGVISACVYNFASF